MSSLLQWIPMQLQKIFQAAIAPLTYFVPRLLLVVAIALLAGPISKKLDKAVRNLFVKFSTNQRFGVTQRRAATLGSLFGSITRYAVWVIGVVVCLSAFGMSHLTNTILATAGIGGLIIGFGAQKLIQDFFAGFIFITDQPFAVGDLVTIGGVTGMVESLKLRVTVIRGLTGEKHILPNGTIAAVANHSSSNSIALCDVLVPVTHTLESIAPILQEASMLALEGNLDMVEPPQVIGITTTNQGMMNIRTICRTKPLTHWPIERTLHAAQLKALRDMGIDQQKV